MDAESAYLRNVKRDRRRIDDRYAAAFDKTTFNDCGNMQNPTNLEDYIVISGKHTFNTQYNTVMHRLHELSLISVMT